MPMFARIIYEVLCTRYLLQQPKSQHHREMDFLLFLSLVSQHEYARGADNADVVGLRRFASEERVLLCIHTVRGLQQKLEITLYVRISYHTIISLRKDIISYHC